MISTLLACVLLLAVNVQGETKITCQNSKMELTCSGNNVIDIVTANYGRSSKDPCKDNKGSTQNTKCAAESTLQIVNEKCNQNQHCVIEASRDVFGDPCYGTFKYLEVEYNCISDEEFKYGLTCAHTDLTISCDGDKDVIKIFDANYGRKTRSICNNGPIVTAYCINSKSTEIAAKLCDDKQSCTLRADPKTFGDPCLGTFKYLWVKYKCVKGGL